MRSGLRKVTKTVKGKRGAVRRTYWVKARVAKVLKVAGAVALAGASAYGAYKLGNRAMAARAGRNVSAWDTASRKSQNEARGHWYHPKDYSRSKRAESLAEEMNRIRQATSDLSMRASDVERWHGHKTGRAPLQLGTGAPRARAESAEERYNRMKRQNEANWNARHKRK